MQRDDNQSTLNAEKPSFAVTKGAFSFLFYVAGCFTIIWPWISTSMVPRCEKWGAAGACPVLRREQLIRPKSLLSTACGRSWSELYYNKGPYKQCQISSAAITMIGPESRDRTPRSVMVHDVDTDRRTWAWNGRVLPQDRENNYLYHLAYSLFDNSLTYSEIAAWTPPWSSCVTNCSHNITWLLAREGVFPLHGE